MSGLQIRREEGGPIEYLNPDNDPMNAVGQMLMESASAAVRVSDMEAQQGVLLLQKAEDTARIQELEETTATLLMELAKLKGGA